MCVVLISACATVESGYHRYMMRGSIVDVVDSSVYLCIGSADGAAVGQELNVYKIVETSANPKTPVFQKKDVGKIKITEIVNEHFARATVLSGSVGKNDIAELVRQ
jgi:hypothetical protein